MEQPRTRNTAVAIVVAAKTRRILAVHFAFALLALAFAVLATAPAFAASGQLTDQQAYTLQQEDKVVVVDVRTQSEWQQTGIAKGAVPISMGDPAFLAKFKQLRAEEPGREIAFVCASGHRSGIVQSELVKRGYDGVFTIVGGMTGNGRQQGWIADGLPTQSWSGPGN